MKKVLAGVLATLTLVSGTVAASAADARDYQGRYYHRDRDDHGDAIVAGIAGLAIGAALASGNRGYSNYSYGYSRPYYGGYYAPPPPRYGYGYGYAPRYRETCRTTSYWDPYYGRYIRQRQCW